MSDKDKAKGKRDFAVRLKTARKRTTSQQAWLRRQLNDPYVAKAKEAGYRSRAAFKLVEIDDKYHLLKPGMRIVDLGAAPGGWCQVAAERIGITDAGGKVGAGFPRKASEEGDAGGKVGAGFPRKASEEGDAGGKAVAGFAQNASAKIVAIDLLEIDPLPGVDFMVMDFTLPEADDILKEKLGGLADGVISDMAANTTGHKKTDHLKIVGLAEMALAFAREVLAPGGFFLCKLFQGGETGELVTDLKRDFTIVRHVKPASSRADSSELYVLATGFRGSREDVQT
ncbi:MAG: RlmE family RNA methyltransferase [Proteobacteria bacterium]|nr:RlmE family RNA methyltransferase [Pseudomonadota bacterium]